MLKYRTFELKHSVEAYILYSAYPPPMFTTHKASHRKNKSLFNLLETHGEPLSFLMRFPHTKDANLQESSLIVCIV